MTAMKDWLCDPGEHGRGALLPEYLFRYMGSDGLAHTVASRQLRLNAWSQMNDPQESHRWSPKPDLIASGDLSAGEIASRVDKTLRGASKLLSLTSDRMPSSTLQSYTCSTEVGRERPSGPTTPRATAESAWFLTPVLSCRRALPCQHETGVTPWSDVCDTRTSR